MTRHNLDSHIFWLLSHQVTPPVGVPATDSHSSTAQVSFTGFEGGEVEQENPTPVQSPAPIQGLARTANVGQNFVRPAIPPSNTPKPSLRERADNSSRESMGRLASASRSTRPALISQQHQLATPASTTSGSSLTQEYAAFIRENNGTPVFKPAIDRSSSKSLGGILQAPQTPRQTPRQTLYNPSNTSNLKLDTVESVDLTGDDSEIPSRSSSSIEFFGGDTVLWTPTAASRPEPPPPKISVRTAKKRKSEEISVASPGKKGTTHRQPEKPESTERANSEDFVDIDDTVAIRGRQRFDEPHKPSVQLSLELQKPGNDFEEEFSITETISRVETRTRKSFSRVPSSTKAPSILDSPPLIPLVRTPSKFDSVLKSRTRETIQVKASPSPAASRNTIICHTPQKRLKQHKERIIQDSDDDDTISMELQASCSPRLPIKPSPKTLDALRSPSRWHQIPLFSPSDKTIKDFSDTKPRTGSPLQPISRNVGTALDSVPPQFHHDSPTKPASALTAKGGSSQLVPSSSIPLDEKMLVSLFLSNASAMTSYELRVQNLKEQNDIASTAYIDEGELVPAALVKERKALLEKEKAYTELGTLRGRRRAHMDERKLLARQIWDLEKAEADSTLLHEQHTQLSEEIRLLEKRIFQLLHTSGAIEDGFGTGLEREYNELVPFQSSKGTEPASFPQGSSTLGSAQIIFQTQFPSKQPYEFPSSKRRSQEEIILRPSNGRSEFPPRSENLGRESPSPVRKLAAPNSIIEQPLVSKKQSDWTKPRSGLKQPNFLHDPYPMDYSFDDDDANFEDLLRDEQEICGSTRVNNVVPDEVEDEYGESGDDSDMVEFAQEVEQRHSLGGGGASKVPTRSFSMTSGSTPGPTKRAQLRTEKDMYSLIDIKAARALGLLNFPWSKDIERFLKERFKLEGFRHHQLNAMNATLEGKDAFVLMPTGGGKSLCYQLPAVVQSGRTKGVTIVISPLLSLMTDQVQHLRKIKVQAATLNSEVSQDERSEIMKHLRELHPEQFLQLLYITPEMISKSNAILNALSTLHKRKKLARIVIDEAHCVSQWGHDFRPDYVALGDIRKRFPNVPIMALTATATENVKIDVMNNLGMKHAEFFSQSFNRPNLHYEVRSKKGKGASKVVLQDIAELIKTKYKNQTGIIYTLSRKGCEQLADQLQTEYKMKAAYYHASMDPAAKSKVQRDWQNGVVKVVVATIAFGMGIDKADVRFVIHHTIPKSLEGYYQETGRAGRDGALSGCYLYYGFQDTKVLKEFIYASEASELQKERQRVMLSNMVQYCENRCDCRRVEVLRYFGEKFFKEDCNARCDNCTSGATFETVDFSTQAQAAMRIVKEVQNSDVTLLHCVDILRGTSSAKVKSLGHESIPQFGAAKDIKRGEVERIFYQLLIRNALAEHNVINKAGFATQYLNLGPKCRGFLAGTEEFNLQVRISTSPQVLLRQKRAKSPKKTTRSAPQGFSSTILTSPLAPKLQKPRSRYNDTTDKLDKFVYAREDFIASDSDDDEAFESAPARRKQRKGTLGDDLGPPITTDQNLARLPEMHRVFIHQFVEDAKKELEKIRNNKNLKKPIFTEANLREMAVHWTTRIEDMRKLPAINSEAVDRWGAKLTPLIERYSNSFEKAMGEDDDRDPEEAMDESNDREINKNSPEVINIPSDSDNEDDDDDDDDDVVDDDEAAVLEAEEGSKYFQSNASSKGSRKLPWPGTASANSYAPKKSGRSGNGYSFKGKNRGGRRNSGRKSNGSGSRRSSSGVSKRKSSGTGKKGTAKMTSVSGPSKQSSIMKQFGKPSGGGGGWMGGGIGMMPT